MHAPDDGARLNVVRFSAAGHAFAVEARRVRAMHLSPQSQSHRIEDLLRLPAQAGSRRWLTLDLGEGRSVCLEVAEPVTLDQVAAGDVRLLPPLVAARTTLPALAAMVVERDGQGLLLLDSVRLFSPPPG